MNNKEKILSSRQEDYTIDEHLEESDVIGIVSILQATKVFSETEVNLAKQEIEETILYGEEVTESKYFTIKDSLGNLIAYASYCPIPITLECWLLDWIAVHPDEQGKGYATKLITAVEDSVRKMKGKYLFIESSSLPESEPIRLCHAKNNFNEIARLPDFYKPGDDKIIYRKIL